jgi:hypothetical protein
VAAAAAAENGGSGDGGGSSDGGESSDGGVLLRQQSRRRQRRRRRATAATATAAHVEVIVAMDGSMMCSEGGHQVVHAGHLGRADGGPTYNADAKRLPKLGKADSTVAR